MRIIAGEFRGRRLLDPEDTATRPITDRVKQSLFDILSPRLPGTQVYDVFSGTGSLGLEALSRGAAGCVFFERHPPAIRRLERNIQTLGVADRCRLVTRDVLTLREPDLALLPPPGLVFFDPPYPLVRERPAELRRALAVLSARLPAEGLVVFRHEKSQATSLGLAVVDERTWGSMSVQFLSPANPPTASASEN